jgi:transcriptional regulator with XRE-family HTH domain
LTGWRLETIILVQESVFSEIGPRRARDVQEFLTGYDGFVAEVDRGLGRPERCSSNRRMGRSMSLSKRIRDLRYAKGWGPDELASRAKISRTALYQIERGNTSRPQAGTLRRISKALGVALEVLLDETPEPMAGEGASALEGTGIPGAMQGQLEGLPGSAVSTLLERAESDRTGGTTLEGSKRAEELVEKFRRLLASPLAEGVARIVEESYRLMPIIPPVATEDSSRYASPVELETEGRRTRGRPRRAV